MYSDVHASDYPKHVTLCITNVMRENSGALPVFGSATPMSVLSGATMMRSPYVVATP